MSHLARKVAAAVLALAAIGFPVSAPAAPMYQKPPIIITCQDGECYGPGIGQNGKPAMRWVTVAQCEAGGGAASGGTCIGGKHHGAAILD